MRDSPRVAADKLRHKEEEMRIRPCIDIHDGKVKQIVGGSLHDRQEKKEDYSACSSFKKEIFGTQKKKVHAQDGEDDQSAWNVRKEESRKQKSDESEKQGSLQENFVSEEDASYYASLYCQRNLPGGHIILLNSAALEPEAYEKDKEQALGALKAYPGGMQIGGGITPQNAEDFLKAGASHVIVTSYVFREGRLDWQRLKTLEETVGREHLVLDLSCRQKADGTYGVVTDRWQKFTELSLCEETLDMLAEHCDEFLIHAADAEGKKKGIQEDVARILGKWQKASGGIVTYAGGVHSLEDLTLLGQLSNSRLDVTVGSALDLFGGSLSLEELQAACV